jgi:hypothetical protein
MARVKTKDKPPAAAPESSSQAAAAGEAIEAVDTVAKLLALAASADEDEARTAAVQAARLMAKHDLVPMPKSDVERVARIAEEAAKTERKAQRAKSDGLLLGGLLGFVASKFVKTGR